MNDLHPDHHLSAKVLDERVRQVELLISNILRIGVSVSLLIVVLGMVVSFIHHPEYLHSNPELHNLTSSGAAFPHSFTQVWQGLRDGHGQAMVVVGLMLLIATPVIRVAVSILAFVYEHDGKFVVFTSLVLALLILAFILGAVG